MIDSQFSLNRNLNDAGCDEMTKKSFLELCASGKMKEGIHLLQKHRIRCLIVFMKVKRKLMLLTFFSSNCGMILTVNTNSLWGYSLTLFRKASF